MTRYLSTGARNDRKLLVIGLLSAFVGTLLVASFHFVDNHRWYWDMAPLISVVAVLGAGSGGLLVGHSLSGTRERCLWLVGLGGILALAWIASGTVAASLGFLGMNYLPAGYVSWETYPITYAVGSFHIGLLQYSVAMGLLGGFSVGFGLARKSEWGVMSSTARVRE